MDDWQSVAGCGAAGVLAVACAYKLVRPRFPVKVNCWFCNVDTVVPYRDQNCFNCPHCEQYNGFTKDGGYNKSIVAQHLTGLNPVTGCDPGDYLEGSAVLCLQCERNQQMKVKQLAIFVPMIADNYDAEIDAYKDHLETVYELCDLCQAVVASELTKQDNILRRKLPAENHHSPPGSAEVSPSTSARKLQCSGLKQSSHSRCSVLMLPFCMLLQHIRTAIRVSVAFFKRKKRSSEEHIDDQKEINLVNKSPFKTGTTSRPDLDLLAKVTEEPIDDLDLELDAVSLGPMSSNMKRSDSGMFSQYGSHSNLSSATAVPQTMQSRPRPLISPAKFHLRLNTSTTARDRRMQSRSLHTDMSSPSGQSSNNIFLQKDLTSDTLFKGLHTADQSDPSTSRPTPDCPSPRSFQWTSENNVLASPLKKNSFWEHSNFAQTHLSQESLSQCKFAFEETRTAHQMAYPESSLKIYPESSLKVYPESPIVILPYRTPVKKSLWQRHVGSSLAANLSEGPQLSPSRQTNPWKSDYETDESFTTSPDGSELRRRLPSSAVCEDSVSVQDGTSRSSSICPVDSTSAARLNGKHRFRNIFLGIILVVSVAVNTLIGLYLYSKSLDWHYWVHP